MIKKKLKDQIKRIWVGTIIGIVIFLLISFFLKSSYPITHHKFNLSDAYEVLKDTLSLAAAFLAPVAALVVFNDWRETHARVNNERVSLDIIDIYHEVNSLICTGYSHYVSNEELRKKDKEKFKKLNDSLKSLINRINLVDSQAEDFKSNVIKLHEIFNLWFFYLDVATNLYINLKSNVNDQEENNNLLQEIKIYEQKTADEVFKFFNILNCLKPLIV